MLRTIVALTSLAASAAPLAASGIPRHASPVSVLPRHEALRTPGIRIWTSGSDLHHRGDRVRMFYRTERDAFVTIFRVDTDGRVQLLFPRTPDDENYGYGGATYSVASYDRTSAFTVDDYPGVGYIFGIASSEPFDFSRVTDNGRWDLHSVYDGRLHGDPRSALEEIAGQLMPQGYADFDTHILPYYVEQRYDYPRFVCYDCHAYTPWAYWDPYQAWCRRYTLVVFNDPYYYYPSYWYPTYYGGRRVVYTQPRGSRYVFKTRDVSAPGIDYRDRRNSPTSTATAPAPRSVDERGTRGMDIGGVGSVPAPRTAGGRRLSPDAGSAPERGRTEDRSAPSGADRGRDTPQQGGGTTDGGRRRVDRQPGIEIVPAPDQQPVLIDGRRPAAPSTGSPERPATRGTEDRPARPPAAPDRTTRPDTRRPSDDGYRTPVPERPATSPGYGDEPRPARPDAGTRPDAAPAPRRPVEQPRSEPPADRTSPPSERPRAEQPRAERPRESPPREAPRPESRPQASPPPRESSPPRESRPQSQPRESRPQSTPSSRSDPGTSRRRP